MTFSCIGPREKTQTTIQKLKSEGYSGIAVLQEDVVLVYNLDVMYDCNLFAVELI